VTENWTKKRLRLTLLGAFLSITAPLGEWFFLSILGGIPANEIWPTFVYTEIFTLITFSGFGYWIGRYADKLEHMAFHDALTNTFNRGYVMEKMDELLEINRRYKEPFSVIMLDLDHFKRVNDSYGHAVGDQTLQAVGECLKDTVRRVDVVGRIGGEEFIVLCPSTTLEESGRLAERLRNAIEALPGERIGHKGPQTASLGVASTERNTDFEARHLIEAADTALYKSKRQGRNQVHLA
jgi:diguanylate cyclase (GGDEF)-like protein